MVGSSIVMELRSLFDPETVRFIEERIDALKPGTEPLWGRMNAAQMMAHSAEVHDVWLGKNLEGTPLLVRLIGPLLKGLLVSRKPYRRNSPTHPQYRVNDPRDFVTEKARLLASVTALSASPREEFRRPIFCHLSQFGV